MTLSAFREAFITSGAADDIATAIDRNTELLVHAITDITTRDLTGVKRIRRVDEADDNRDYIYRFDAVSVEAHSPPEIIHDSAANVFVLVRQGWEPVAVVTAQATFDMNANSRFLLTVDATCELQVPDGLDGESFSIRVLVSGAGHTITVASGFQGSAPSIQNGDGQETILEGRILDSGPKTGVIHTVKNI